MKLIAEGSSSINFAMAAGDYWGWFGSRSYHHTGMVSMWYVSGPKGWM